MPPKSRRDWSKPPMRVYGPGKRHMELIPSVSRSSGLDKDGDALRSPKVQEEYRDFIQDKVKDHWERFPYESEVRDIKQRDEVQGNLLILFRKLREGMLSAKRTDPFALEVYETSLYLSIIFNSPAQTTSVITHLLPTMYQALPYASPMVASLLSSLHFLLSGYPSQGRYLEHLHSLPPSFLPESHEAKTWLQDLSRTLRLRNYSRLEDLTSRSTCERIVATVRNSGVDTSAVPPHKYSLAVDLPLEALSTLLDSLREKVRETIWVVLRVAYRELSLPKPSDSDPAPTRSWLYRSLVLGPVAKVSSPIKVDDIKLLDMWIEKRRAQGDIQAKVGVEGRWTVIKPRLV